MIQLSRLDLGSAKCQFKKSCDSVTVLDHTQSNCLAGLPLLIDTDIKLTVSRTKLNQPELKIQNNLCFPFSRESLFQNLCLNENSWFGLFSRKCIDRETIFCTVQVYRRDTPA